MKIKYGYLCTEFGLRNYSCGTIYYLDETDFDEYFTERRWFRQAYDNQGNQLTVYID